MSTPTPITAPKEPTESQNYQAIQNRLSDAKAILALIEDRDGKMDRAGGGLVCYTTYELAAGVVRRMLDDLDKEVDRMDTEAGRVRP